MKKKRGNFTYYLGGNLDDFLYSIEEVYEDLEEGMFANKFNWKWLKTSRIQFLCEDSDENHSTYVDDLRSDEILRFKKLSNIFDYLFDEFFVDFNKEVEDGLEGGIDEFDSISKKEEFLERIFDNFLVIRENKTDKTFSIIGKQEISHCFDQMLDLMSDSVSDYLETSLDKQNSVVLGEKFDEFIELIEGLFGEDSNAHITVSASGDFEDGQSRTYDFAIFKQNSKMHKDFKKHAVLEDETPSKNGFIYECPLDKFKHFVLWNLMWKRTMGCAFRVLLGEFDPKAKQRQLSRVYGFLLYPQGNSDGSIEFSFFQSNAQQLLESFSVDPTTNKKLTPDDRTIYCGKDSKDVICGFDLN